VETAEITLDFRYRRVLRIPWTARRRHEEILEGTGGIQLRSSVVVIRLRYFGHSMRKEDENLDGEMTHRRNEMTEDSRGRGRPRRAWCDAIKESTNLSTDELLQSTKDRVAWRSVSEIADQCCPLVNHK